MCFLHALTPSSSHTHTHTHPSPPHTHLTCALTAGTSQQNAGQGGAPSALGAQASDGNHSSAIDEIDHRTGAPGNPSQMSRSDSNPEFAPAWGHALLQNASTFMGLSKRDKKDAKLGDAKGKAAPGVSGGGGRLARPRSWGEKRAEKRADAKGKGKANSNPFAQQFASKDVVLPVDIGLTLGPPSRGDLEGGGPASHRLPRLGNLLLHLQSALWATGAAALWAKHERLRMILLSGHWAVMRGAIETPPLPATRLYEEGVRCLVTMAGHLARTAEGLLESIASLPAAQSNRLLHFGASEAIQGASANWEGLSRSLRELCLRLKLRTGGERVAGRYLEVDEITTDSAWPSVDDAVAN